MGNIIWLASYPKSGNTWLRAFLANLLADRRTPLEPSELHEYGDAEALTPRFTELAGKSSTMLQAGELAALRMQVHDLIAQRTRGTRLVKTHNFNGSFNGYPLINWQVSAGAIYVIRNPLDVAISMTHHFGLAADDAIERLGDERVASINDDFFVSHFIGSWSTHVKSWADMAAHAPGRVIVLRYEDLLEKPEKYFAKAAKLIGLGREKGRIGRAVRHANFQTLAALEKKHGFVEAVDEKTAFFNKGCANQWRDVLSHEQVQRIVDRHQEQMQRFNYVPAGF